MINIEPNRPRLHLKIPSAEETGTARLASLHTLGEIGGDGELTKRFLD